MSPLYGIVIQLNLKFKEGATFYRCPAEFGVFIQGRGVNIYKCNLLILETKHGVRYAYDIVDMQKPILAATSSLSSETLERLQRDGTHGGVGLLKNKPNSSSEVKEKFLPHYSVTAAEDAAYLDAVKRGDNR